MATVNNEKQVPRKQKSSFCLGFTSFCLLVSIGFILTIIITAAITYSLTYNAYFIGIKIDGKEDVTPPKGVIPADEVDVRLPTSLVPRQYDIKLQPFLDEAMNYTFTGYETITFEVAEPTNQIIFHINDIEIDNSSLIITPLDGDQTPTIKSVDTDKDRQFFIITVDIYLRGGSTYSLAMNFTGFLNDNLVGFYRSVYQDADGQDVLLATTQFESTDARRAFPCFDEPALKANFKISILREGARRRAISNMPRIATYQAEAPWNGWYWDEFENSLPMSTYLVAFVLSDFEEVVSDANDHVTFRVWARVEAIDQAGYALQLGPDVLTFYEGYFNIAFPLPKQDMVALPDFDAGAMENWGLITYRETALLFDPNLGSATNKQRVGVVVAHELAHQWFGDLVTPSWWDYLWLNEGFAAYMENTGLDAVEPTFYMLDQFVLENNLYAFSIDCLESSHPIYIEVNNPDEIGEIFDSISYNKGATVIRMMEFILTTATFKAGLTNYLNEYSYSSATQDNLWASLTEQAQIDGTLPTNVTVKQIMDTWTNQMGYPVINVTRSSDGSSVHLTQERFLLVKNLDSNDTNDYTWWVPLTFATKENPNFNDTYPQQFMNDTETSKDLDIELSNNTWIIFNIRLGGFYRVNYDEHNWNLIIQQLIDDLSVITLVNRAQVLDDALNLARAGYINYELALEVYSYLVQETQYVPWSAALSNLNYLEEMFTRTAGYGAMKDYLLTLLTPLYNTIGFEDSLSDPHLEQLSRVLASSWVCHLQYEPCVESAVNLYSQWMSFPDNNTIISPNLKSTVFCTAIAEGDEIEWDFAYNTYLSSNLGSDKEYLLSAMGCTKQIWLLTRYLEMAFTEQYGIRKQDSYKVFDSVANNDIGRDLAWEYLQVNWDDIAAYYGSPTSVADLALYVSSEFNTQLKLDELISLRDEHIDDLGSATQSLDQAIEKVQNNIDWMNNYYSEINQWLIAEGYGDWDGGSELHPK